jgi:DNA-binding response OmpR family regulator
MNKKVLIVEDDPKIRENLKYALVMKGFEVFEASNGLAGLELARTKRPPIIFFDLLISKIDGFKAVRLLKFDERFKSIITIAITQLSREETREEARKVGFDYFFPKPLDYEAVANKTEKILQERQQ